MLFPLLIGASGIAGFIACNNLSRRNSDPTKASRPWDSVMLLNSLPLLHPTWQYKYFNHILLYYIFCDLSRITMDSLWEKELELCFWKSLIMLRLLPGIIFQVLWVFYKVSFSSDVVIYLHSLILQRRRANIYAEFKGGSSTYAYHISEPRLNG